MAKRALQLSPLERTLARLKKQEQNLWGRIQRVGDVWLVFLERSALVKSYATLFRKRNATSSYLSEPVIDLDSLLLLSLIFHLILFFLLTRLSVLPSRMTTEAPIVVHILDSGRPAAPEARKEPPKRIIARKTPDRAPVRPRPKPKPTPVQVAKPAPVNPIPKPSPEPAPLAPLPQPKAIAQASQENIARIAPSSAESLVQLPTRPAEPVHSLPTTPTGPVSGMPRAGDAAEPVPEGLRRGDIRQPGTSAGKTDLPALTSPDFAPYLEMIKKRVQAVWKYPEGISGTHQVSIIFVLDRAGKVVRAEVAGSTDPRLASGAIQAMRTASPFPPIPDSLRELAGWPLRIRFTVEFGVKAHK